MRQPIWPQNRMTWATHAYTKVPVSASSVPSAARSRSCERERTAALAALEPPDANRCTDAEPEDAAAEEIELPLDDALSSPCSCFCLTASSESYNASAWSLKWLANAQNALRKHDANARIDFIKGKTKKNTKQALLKALSGSRK